MSTITGSLEGKVAVITGASSGIGRAIALRFAEEGAAVVVSSRNTEQCDQVVSEIKHQRGQAITIGCDVNEEQDVIHLFDHTVARLGRIDIAVANAGISGGNTTIEDYSLADWNRVLKTNLTGVFLTVREAFRRMKEKGGSILILSSQAGVFGYPRKGPYCATKFGVRGLAHVLAEEGRQYDISVSTICPGTVETPILAATNTKVRHPMSTSAVADAALYLAKLGGNVLVRDLILERRHLD
jgi:NAD(P)-dependent dehydrogenase (short-subunit alcohol dehydrogenase family)